MCGKKCIKLTRYITTKPVIYIEVFTVKGKISNYLSFRGYGFISVEEQEKDIFFHSSKYPVREIPTQGQWVEFTVEETEKGKEAVNIKIVRDSSERVEEPVKANKVPEEMMETARASRSRHVAHASMLGGSIQRIWWKVLNVGL